MKVLLVEVTKIETGKYDARLFCDEIEHRYVFTLGPVIIGDVTLTLINSTPWHVRDLSDAPDGVILQLQEAIGKIHNGENLSLPVSLCS